MESIILYFLHMSITIKILNMNTLPIYFPRKKHKYIFFSSFRSFVFCLFLLLLSLLLSSSFIFVVIVSRLTVDLSFFRVSEITIYYRSCTDNENICVNFVFPIFFFVLLFFYLVVIGCHSEPT